jgi:hypothetical protein
MSGRSLKKGYCGSSCACACGASAKFVNWREKSVMSAFGDIRLSCSYYRCVHCRQSQQPWDEQLRLGSRRVTAGAEEVITLAGLLSSFQQAAQSTLIRLTGIRVSESTVRRVTEEAGENLAQRLANKETFGPLESWDWQEDARGKGCAYTAIDHVSVPQQGPGGAKAESRMAAVAMIYNPQPKHDLAAGGQTRGGCPVRFLSGLYELDRLGLALRRQAAQVGWDSAEQQLALSDAGNGLEQFAAKNFPLSEPILDFFHASEHVTALTKVLHPHNEAAAAAQAATWCHQLKHAGGSALLAEWEQLDSGRWSDERREIYRQEVQYFRNHQHRMDYPRYIANGWQIGSGPVESGCKRLVTQRLKGAGMRWKERGTHTMCHLRALLLLCHPDQWAHAWAASPPQLHLQN